MPTLIYVCGAECGLEASGAPTTGRHFSGGISNVTNVTSGPSSMLSDRCLRFNTTAAISNIGHLLASSVASPATQVARFYIYFASLPSGNCAIYSSLAPVASVRTTIQFVSSDSTLRAGGSSVGTTAASGIAITTGVWYRLDIKAVHATATTMDLQVDGVAATQYTATVSNAGGAGFNLGTISSVTADFYIDDFILSGTSGDYPIGPGTVVGLYPNADLPNSTASPTDGNGGHFYSAVGDFGKGSGGGTNLDAQESESTSWQSLANPLSASVATNFVSNRLGTSLERLTWRHESMPSNTDTVNGVMVVVTTHSASTTSNRQTMVITDSAGANGTFILNNVDLSETTIVVPCAIIIAQPGGGAWTKAGVDGSMLQWGFSADVTPDVYIDGFCLEVDYVPLSGRPLWVAKKGQRPRLVRSIRTSTVT